MIFFTKAELGLVGVRRLGAERRHRRRAASLDDQVPAALNEIHLQVGPGNGTGGHEDNVRGRIEPNLSHFISLRPKHLDL